MGGGCSACLVWRGASSFGKAAGDISDLVVFGEMRVVESLERGLQILDMLSESSDSIGVTQVAASLSIDKASAHRLLATLQVHGHVEQDEHRRYRLSYKPVRLGMAYLSKLELPLRARPYLAELVARTSETAFLAKLTLGRVVYVDRLASPQPVSVNTRIGDEAPLHCTAGGKALLAYMAPADLQRFLEGCSFQRYTPRTITDPDVLRHHLQEIRERGYAVDDEERFVGVRCIAAPVRDHSGNATAAVGVVGPAHRVTLERQGELQQTVTQIALELSRSIGFRSAD